MDSNILRVAAEVIAISNRDNPADRVLRDVLRAHREMTPAELAQISAAVFAYYRWLGWVGTEENITTRTQRALDLADRFRINPLGLSVSALRAKAVPGWTAEEMEVSDAWLRSLQGEPKLWLRANRSQGSALAKKLPGALTSASMPDALSYEGGEDLFRTPEFHAGEFEIQDINSQAVGWLCDPQPGETWWDTCAGEGGKMLHLSVLMRNKGLIWATDRATWRLQKLKRRAARAKVFNYRTALWDGGAKLPTKTKFDGVLVDAPCSGLGTWQRNPHARWTTTREDVKELSEIQVRLLLNAAPSVKPGGKLIYAVCTLTRKETVEITAAFEKQFPEFKPLPLLNPFKPRETGANHLWLWPQSTGGNGLFVAVWRRHAKSS